MKLKKVDEASEIPEIVKKKRRVKSDGTLELSVGLKLDSLNWQS